MKDQLLLLDELQGHDARIAELEAEIQGIPAKLTELEENINSIQAVLEREKVQLEETERYRIEQETQLKHEEQQLQRAKQKASSVKNQKEYISLQREIETTRKMAVEREEEVLKLVEAVEVYREKIQSHSADLDKLREHFAAQEDDGKAQMGKLEEQMAGLRTERDELAGRVRPDVLKKYSTIRMRKGLAVVAVTDGICSGCNMMIPPQLYNLLQRRETIELCPSCHRIIYWDKIMEDVSLERGEDAEKRPVA